MGGAASIGPSRSPVSQINLHICEVVQELKPRAVVSGRSEHDRLGVSGWQRKSTRYLARYLVLLSAVFLTRRVKLKVFQDLSVAEAFGSSDRPQAFLD